MRKGTLTIAFVLAIFLLLVVSILRTISPTGNATYLDGALCFEGSDCSQGNVCCLFFNQTSGVCDAAENCRIIYAQTQSLALPAIEAPKEVDQGPIYAVVVSLLCAVLVIGYIFFRTARD